MIREIYSAVILAMMSFSINAQLLTFSQNLGASDLTNPQDVEVDSDGNIYVLDYGAYKVFKFSSEGTLITSFGTHGLSDGQFWDPNGIALDSKNNVYVSDRIHNDVHVFTSEGTYTKTLGGTGSEDGQFKSPHGITIDNDDNLFVVDDGNLRLQKFDSNGVFINTWALTNTDGDWFTQINDVAHDNDGNIFVLDGALIKKFNNTGILLASWGTLGAGTGQLSSYVPGLAIDENGNVYVSDGYAYEIEVFDNDGNYIETFGGSQGSEDGEFNYNAGIAMSSKGLLVCDYSNARLVELGLNVTGFSGQYTSVEYINSNIVSSNILLNDVEGFVQILNTQGVVVSSLDVPFRESVSIDISNLENGQYQLKTVTKTDMSIEKFVVVK